MTPDSETRAQVWKFPIAQKNFRRDRAGYARVRPRTSGAFPCRMPARGFGLTARKRPDAPAMFKFDFSTAAEWRLTDSPAVEIWNCQPLADRMHKLARARVAN
jgi:hypothetical protein